VIGPSCCVVCGAPVAERSYAHCGQLVCIAALLGRPVEHVLDRALTDGHIVATVGEPDQFISSDEDAP